MDALAATVSALTGFGVMAIAGVSHIRHTANFRESVAHHHLWPEWLIAPGTAILAIVEVLIGLAGIVSLTVAGLILRYPNTARVAMILCCVMYVGFAIYGRFLLLKRPEAPCACSVNDVPTNVWVPVRSIVLAGACIVAAMANDYVTVASSSPIDLLIVLFGAAVFIVLGWNLPLALHDPAPTRQSSVA